MQPNPPALSTNDVQLAPLRPDELCDDSESEYDAEEKTSYERGDHEGLLRPRRESKSIKSYRNLLHLLSSRNQPWKKSVFLLIILLLVGGVVGFLIVLWSTYSASTQPSFPDAVFTRLLGDAIYGVDRAFEQEEGVIPLTAPGKKLCILDVDTRPWDVHNGIEEDSQLYWGHLNHWIYAKIHGYDYKFVQVTETPGLHATWVKVEEIQRALRQGYDTVVFVDGDVIFHRLKIPMEQLMHRWNITREIVLTAALTPNNKYTSDMHGRTNVNTGFMVVQNTPDADQMFTDWVDCPTDVKYPSCSRWKDKVFHEQSAYSNFIRYDYANVTKEIPCNEANGSPEFNRAGDLCHGKYVRHYWTCKKCVRKAVKASLSDLYFPSLADELAHEWDTSVYEDHRHIDRNL